MADPQAAVGVGYRSAGAGRPGSSLGGGPLVPTQARFLSLRPAPRLSRESEGAFPGEPALCAKTTGSLELLVIPRFRSRGLLGLAASRSARHLRRSVGHGPQQRSAGRRQVAGGGRDACPCVRPLAGRPDSRTSRSQARAARGSPQTRPAFRAVGRADRCRLAGGMAFCSSWVACVPRVLSPRCLR